MAQIHRTQAGAIVDAEKQKNPAAGARLSLADVPAAQPEVGKAEAALLKAIELNPALRNGYMMLADLYIAAGKQQQALERLNSLLSKTNDVPALMQVGILHESAKEYPAAKDAYEKLLTINTNFSPALNNLAYIYCERLGDLDKAYQLAERARKNLPNDPAPADTLGWVLYRRGEYNRAVTLLQESATKLSSEPEVQFHLGMTQYMLGNEDAARSALQEAVKGGKDFTGKDEAARRLVVLGIDPKTAGPEVVADLQKQLQSSPRDPIALERLGAIQERDGAFDKAAQTYQTALNYNPQDSALTLKMADLYSSHLNDPQKALALAKSAHDMAPDNARISALLGHLVLQNGDSKWAASLLEDSARNLPNDPQVSFDLGWAYYSLGRVAEAQQLMQNAAKAGPAFKEAAEAQQFLSAVKAANDPNRVKAFAPEAQKILVTDSNYVPALMVSAEVQQQQGNSDSAAATYNAVLARFPSFSPAKRNLGLLYFARGDDDKAYDLLNRARENFPQDADVAKGLGVLTCRKGNYGRAAQLLQESLQSRKDDPETLYYLGKAQYELKAKSESKASLKKALEFNLSEKLAGDARRLLAELK
jgi:tetratricopeptide (TPR) repeat protein